jgi:uncharacterized protein (DUF427 family)
MTVHRLDIPLTPRTARLARAWRRTSKPATVESPGPGQESVWDYPRPPAVETVPVRVQVFLGSHVVADSRAAVRVLETASPPTVYLPPADVDRATLLPERTTSVCEWKGTARYLTVRAGGLLARNAAWYYPDPCEEYALLADYLSFYPGRMTRCLYGGEEVTAQAGSFYGGWVTSNLVGPFKGEPGSEGW